MKESGKYVSCFPQNYLAHLFSTRAT